MAFLCHARRRQYQLTQAAFKIQTLEKTRPQARFFIAAKFRTSR